MVRSMLNHIRVSKDSKFIFEIGCGKLPQDKAESRVRELKNSIDECFDGHYVLIMATTEYQNNLTVIDFEE